MRIGIFNRLYHFAFGYFFIETETQERARLLSLFLQENIMAYPREDSFLVAKGNEKKLVAAAKRQGLSLSISNIQGLPALLSQNKGRAGLFFGAMIVIIMTIMSCRVVWRVEVAGNELLSAEEIRADLAQIGFGVGSVISKTDFSEVTAALRLRYTEIAHADIYCVGTTAYVHIQEASTPPKEDEDTSFAHLVADRDAVITGFDIRHGRVVVKEGEVVKKGDLLVSGIVEGVHGDTLLRASGEVYGTVTEQIVVEIPRQEQKYKVIDSQNAKITLFFFGKAINIQKNAGNLPSTYGTIVEEEKWTLPNGTPLPFSYTVEKAIVYEAESVCLDYEEMLRLGLAKLKGRLEATLANGHLISKTVEALTSEDSCIIKCTVTYVTCISGTQPILVGE